MRNSEFYVARADVFVSGFPDSPLFLITARIFLLVSLASHSLKTFLNGINSLSEPFSLSTLSFIAIK